MRLAVATAVLVVAVPVGLVACGGSSPKTSTPADVCTQMTNIAGTLKNLHTGLESGEASIDAITYTTSQLKQEFALLDEAVATLEDPNVATLQESFHQLRLAYGRLPPGTTPKEAQTALKGPVDDVRASWTALMDSLTCASG